jgi:uncharacterized protein YndB with AHSA1/START domain
MEPSTVHNTFVIDHHYPYPPTTLFAAFSEPARKRRWFADRDGQHAEQFGGIERVLYRMGPETPFPGVAISTVATYQDIVPNLRVVFAQTMTLGDRHITSALVTFEFLPNAAGTDLICTHQGAFYEGSDGPKMREDGWRRLLDLLEKSLAG